LAEVRVRLERWRRRHGGPGMRIPEELWTEAARVAQVEGIGTTARTLRLRREGLSKRIEGAHRDEGEGASPGSAFVQLDMRDLCSPGRAVVELEGEGERVRVEMTGAPTVDVIALAQAFWNRRRCSN